MSNHTDHSRDVSSSVYQTSSEVSQTAPDMLRAEDVIQRILSDTMWTSQDIQTLTIIFPELNQEHQTHVDISRTPQSPVQLSNPEQKSQNHLPVPQMDQRSSLNTNEGTFDALPCGGSAKDAPAISPKRPKVVFRRSNVSKRFHVESASISELKENVSPAINMTGSV
jgi:hypothetical protein